MLHGSIRLSPAVQALIDAADANTAGPSTSESSTFEHGGAAEATSAVQAAETPEKHKEEASADVMGLVSLVVKGCSITEGGVRSLVLPAARSARSLQHLDVSNCSRVALACLQHVPKHAALHTLRANGCRGIGSLSVELPPDCPLGDVSLRECGNAASLHLTAPALRRLSMHASPRLRSISLGAPRLEELLATQCIALTALELRGAAMSAASHLRTLNLLGCTMLPAATLHAVLASARQLTRLDVSACSSLAALVVPGAARVFISRVSASSCNTWKLKLQRQARAQRGCVQVVNRRQPFC